MYELHCQTINRKCVLDRHVSVKTVVLKDEQEIIKPFFVLNATEQEIYPADKC